MIPTSTAVEPTEAVASRKPVPRLPATSRPEAGETIHSFMRRLAELNGQTNMNTFMSSLSLLGSFGAESDQPQWDRLSAATGVAMAELAPLRWERVASPSGHGSSPRILGSPLAAAFVNPNTLHLCPECVAERRSAREFWTIGHVVACPRHERLLAERCPDCGWEYAGSRVGHPWMCICGSAFEAQKTSPAPAAALRMARNVAVMAGQTLSTGFHDPDFILDLPTCLGQPTVHDYLACVHVIGTAATTPPEEDPFQEGLGRSYPSSGRRSAPSVAKTVASIEAAHAILDDWPRAYERLLANIEARSVGRSGADTFVGAFSTRIGRSLRHPIRGSDGLPLPMLHKAIDTYWDSQHEQKRRGRNMTTSDPAARRVHAHFTVKELALAVGDDQGRTFHSRIVRRVLSQLGPEELALDDVSLAKIVRDRSVALATLSLDSLSSAATQAELEGGAHSRTLDGWEHPELLPADGIVQGLRFKDGCMYLATSVEAARRRLASITTAITDSDGYVSVTETALRRGAIRPWYTKTDFLLDLLRGRIKAYSLVPNPRLCDILVDHQAVRDLSGACNPALLPSSPGYAPMNRINDLLRHRHGEDGTVTLDQFRRLVKWAVVRHVVATKQVASKDREVSTRHYNVEDVCRVVGLRLNGGTLTDVEAASFAPTQDVGKVVRDALAAGKSSRSAAVELSQQGFLTPAGFEWCHTSLEAAVRRTANGDGIIHALPTPGR